MALVNRRALFAVAAALGMIVCGCGNPGLWERWRAERALWQARGEDLRARESGSEVTPARLERVRRDYVRVSDAYPPGRWVPLAARGDTLARDVARVSAAAATRAAELDAELGRGQDARRALERVAEAYSPVWPSAFEARVALGGLLDAAGDSGAALVAWEAAARDAPVVDPDSGRVCGRTFAAAHRVAGAHRAAGRRLAADSVWAAMTAAVETALCSHTGDSLAPALWIRRAEAGMERGGAEGIATARSSLRQALAERAGAPFAFEAMLGLGEVALAAGQRDSAVAWARRAADLAGPSGLEASTDLEVRAWTEAGRIDSAAASLDRLAGTRHLPAGVATVARFREGLLLERLGRWELARTAFHTVIASDALHPAAFASLERLTLHQLEQRETDLVDDEARRGLDQVDRILATVRDPDVRTRALQTRARLTGWMGDEPGALQAWEGLWRERPGTPEGVEAGFEAAALAVHLNDRVHALNLYGELARQAPRPAARDSARRAAEALERDPAGTR